MKLFASPARSYPLQVQFLRQMKLRIEKALPVKDERGHYFTRGTTLFRSIFLKKSILIKRNNGRSRGNCSIQTHRRPSTHMLRGKLAAYSVFPLSQSMCLLLLLTVPC